MNSLVHKSRKLISILKEDPRVQLLRCDAALGTEEHRESVSKLIQRLNKKFGFHLSDVFFDYFMFNPNRFSIHFDFNHAEHDLTGEFHLPFLGLVFRAHKLSDNLAFEGLSEAELSLWNSFKCFDTRPEIGDAKMAVFSFQEGVSPPTEPLIYFLDRDVATKMKIDLGGYLNAMLDMAGIADWQYLFTDISMQPAPFAHLYLQLKKSLNALSVLFSENDYTEYYERLEQRNQ